MTVNTKLTFQKNAPVNSFRLDVSTHSTATLCSSIQKPTARRLFQVRRENALNGNAVLFQSDTNLFLGKTEKTKQNIFWEILRPDSKKMFFVFTKKVGFRKKNQRFPGKTEKKLFGNYLLGIYTARLQKMFFVLFFRCSLGKLVFGGKTNFFL